MSEHRHPEKSSHEHWTSTMDIQPYDHLFEPIVTGIEQRHSIKMDDYNHDISPATPEQINEAYLVTGILIGLRDILNHLYSGEESTDTEAAAGLERTDLLDQVIGRRLGWLDRHEKREKSDSSNESHAADHCNSTEPTCSGKTALPKRVFLNPSVRRHNGHCHFAESDMDLKESGEMIEEESPTLVNSVDALELRDPQVSGPVEGTGVQIE